MASYRPKKKIDDKGTTVDLPLDAETLNGKTADNFQEKLTFDTTPTAGSMNPVTSDGIKSALEDHYPSLATADKAGLIKIGFTQGARFYPVQLDVKDRAYVHVPWVDTRSAVTKAQETADRAADAAETNRQSISYLETNKAAKSEAIKTASVSGRDITFTRGDGTTFTLTTQDTNTEYFAATADKAGLIRTGFTETGKNYAVKLNATGQAYVHVPWVDFAGLEADLEHFDEAISDLQYDMGLALLTHTIPIEYGKNLNDYKSNSIYRLQVGVTNQPSYTDYGTMVVFRNTVDTGFQIVSGHNQGTLYYRGFNTDGFDAWCKLSGFDNPNDYGFNYIDNMVSNQNDNFKVRGTIHTKRLAGNILEVEFYGKVEAKDSSDSYSYSFLHPNVISSLKGLTVYTNEHLMYASEVTYYETTGEINKDKTGYGGMMFFSENNGFVFARIYDENGNGGGWGSATLTVGTYVKGKVYYKVS